MYLAQGWTIVHSCLICLLKETIYNISARIKTVFLNPYIILIRDIQEFLPVEGIELTYRMLRKTEYPYF